MAPLNTNDAAILEFLFTSTTNQVAFEYQFASEEYNEFTNSSFNDIFGFFVNGNDIAFIPGTTTPVSINNVNGGNPLGIDASNPAFFNNNDLNDGGPFFDIEYDGFTSVFTATSVVNPGINSIKLAIADVGDSSWDSGVFIKGQGFSGEIPGTNPDDPLLPDIIGDGGGFIFDDISIFDTDEFYFFDPDVAIGYEYIATGANITEVLLPDNIGDLDNQYNLLADSSGGSCSSFAPTGDVIAGGSPFVLSSPVPCFAIDGIDVNAGLDPTDPLAFNTGLKFDSTGLIDLTQTPIVQSHDTPETLTLLGATVAIMFGRSFKKGKKGDRSS